MTESTTAAKAGERTTTVEPAATAPAQTGGELFAWDFAQVDEGDKASVDADADADRVAHVAYMLEAMPGWIKYARRDGDGWEITQVTEGYLYGPLSLAVDRAGTPRIVWHDHQSDQLNPELGDQALATLRDGAWAKEFIENSGHDGWDNSVALDSAGGTWAASIYPSEFGATTAVYVSHFDGSGWSVSAISEENSAAAEEVSASTEEMNSQISLMASTARDLAVLAQMLQGAVSRFTLDESAGDGQSAPAIESEGGATRMLPAPNGSTETADVEATA